MSMSCSRIAREREGAEDSAFGSALGYAGGLQSEVVVIAMLTDIY